MRWENLFADLEAQASALEREHRAAEVEERSRGEFGSLTLCDRLRAGLGARLHVRLTGGTVIVGALERVGSDWLLLAETGARETLVATAAVSGVRGLSRYSAPPGSAPVVGSRLGLRVVLRRLARDRLPSRLVLVDGHVLDATIDRVGADCVEIAVHPPGEFRRRAQVREIDVVPMAALAAVRRSV